MKPESLVKLNRCERSSRFFRHGILPVALALGISVGLKADLSFETETARMLGVGKMEFSAAGEYQFSKEGGEFALPFAYELGLHPRLALLIEPTPCVWISHKHQPVIRGLGDTEVTATYLLKKETDNLPAFAFAGEVKLPTAHNRGIGTGRVDYAVYLVASKRFGPMDVHANIAYTFVGKPPGASVQNTTAFALAAELPLSPSTDLFTEVMYTTSALGGGSEASGVTSEIGVDELIGTVGLRHHFSRQFVGFSSLSFDNAHTTLLRVGGTWYF